MHALVVQQTPCFPNRPSDCTFRSLYLDSGFMDEEQLILRLGDNGKDALTQDFYIDWTRVRKSHGAIDHALSKV